MAEPPGDRRRIGILRAALGGAVAAVRSVFSSEPEGSAERGTLFPQLNPTPQGLTRIHRAASEPEAHLLREVLLAEGFRIEHVPSYSMGLFGHSANTDIFVHAAEAAEASQFIADYLAAPIEPEDEPES